MRLNNTHTPSTIHRRDGATTAERYLKRLCERSFLSLWSYAGVYRDQLDAPTAKLGKEVCDLLVVFENHIIVFSDKDCAYPAGDDEELNWRRWFKPNPQRLFLDPACTQRFPIPLPDPATAVFHRIIVAHGASEQCKALFGGSGSLMMDSTVIGSMHTASPA